MFFFDMCNAVAAREDRKPTIGGALVVNILFVFF